MKQLKRINNFVTLIKKQINIDGLFLILYGSTVYGVDHSDLDICFLSERTFSNEEFETLKKITFDFHVNNKLRIDEDISFDDKLLYTKEFMFETFSNLPFKYKNGKYLISQIKKTKKFLSSIEMRKRLLLNILTVKRKVLIGNVKEIDKYSKIAWSKIIKIVMSYAEIKEVTINEFVNLIYKDPFCGKEGEMYLGYKNNLADKKTFLLKEVERIFKYFVKSGEMYFNKSNKKYGILDGDINEKN